MLALSRGLAGLTHLGAATILALLCLSGTTHAASQDCREHSGDENTPWGKASVKERTCPAADGGMRTTHEYRFAGDPALAPKKLTRMQTYFLRQHKCVAVVAAGLPLADANGQIWPQLQLEGRCAAAERYRTVFLLAQGRLYRLTISYPLFMEPAPEAGEALRNWVGSFLAEP